MKADLQFSRALLKQILPDVLKHTAHHVNLFEAWVWKARENLWEFHFHDFYWCGRAGNAYEARYNGWAAYLASLGVKEYMKGEKR